MPTMLPRDRIFAAVNFQATDVLPCIILEAPGGFYDHGQKLLDLMRVCGSDFSNLDLAKVPPGPPASDFGSDGKYHAIKTDEWGITWEYRIFGVWGHPIRWPLADITQLDAYRLPPVPATSGPEFDAACARGRQQRERYFQLANVTGMFERMSDLRPFEETLMDIAEDTPEINRLADRLTERAHEEVRYALALGADAISVCDDFGTRSACFFSPQRFREFFKPRYQAIFAPVKKAGKKVFFHSCGQVWDILEDLRDIGVDAIWPQLPVYDLAALARRCWELRIAVQLHPDRGDLMQNGPAAQVREYVLRLLETFRTMEGGSFLHIEIDPNFKWENVEMLLKVATELRRGG